MKQVLVYADSLSWGIIPDTRKRFESDQRWPGKLEQLLCQNGSQVRVIEDCLNGRRTVLNDPFKPGRNGAQGLQQTIEINSPLELVIIMLGNNDFQSPHTFTATEAAQGVATLVQTIRSAPIEPGMPVPPVLLICPPPIIEPKGSIAAKFKGAEEKCKGFDLALQKIAADTQCNFFDAGTVISASKIDGIHLDLDQHQQLALSILPLVQGILSR
ncbi:SGNH/GDSL hydrolase family protein [uncultured Amphritea sp.]|uniref:SGNH/GDSL hydrolase family protein n=1 Tax=uncultured Amphritea sp. TaxID=981605 RepID=UPI002625B85C|nr:SGNH/GDSL hydrolase family protein [uncultured Amphritea sp.]